MVQQRSSSSLFCRRPLWAVLNHPPCLLLQKYWWNNHTNSAEGSICTFFYISVLFLWSLLKYRYKKKKKSILLLAIRTTIYLEKKNWGLSLCLSPSPPLSLISWRYFIITVNIYVWNNTDASKVQSIYKWVMNCLLCFHLFVLFCRIRTRSPLEELVTTSFSSDCFLHFFLSLPFVVEGWMYMKLLYRRMAITLRRLFLTDQSGRY